MEASGLYTPWFKSEVNPSQRRKSSGKPCSNPMFSTARIASSKKKSQQVSWGGKIEYSRYNLRIHMIQKAVKDQKVGLRMTIMWYIMICNQLQHNLNPGTGIFYILVYGRKGMNMHGHDTCVFELQATPLEDRSQFKQAVHFWKMFTISGLHSSICQE